jgi:hypothetical protein
MPITPFLAGQTFDPIDTMSDVLERICAEVGVGFARTGKNAAAEIIAAKIIKHAQQMGRRTS